MSHDLALICCTCVEFGFIRTTSCVSVARHLIAKLLLPSCHVLLMFMVMVKVMFTLLVLVLRSSWFHSLKYSVIVLDSYH